MASLGRLRRLSDRPRKPVSSACFKLRDPKRCIELHLKRDALLTASPASITACRATATPKTTGNHRF